MSYWSGPYFEQPYFEAGYWGEDEAVERVTGAGVGYLYEAEDWPEYIRAELQEQRDLSRERRQQSKEKLRAKLEELFTAAKRAEKQPKPQKTGKQEQKTAERVPLPEIPWLDLWTEIAKEHERVRAKELALKEVLEAERLAELQREAEILAIQEEILAQYAEQLLDEEILALLI